MSFWAKIHITGPIKLMGSASASRDQFPLHPGKVQLWPSSSVRARGAVLFYSILWNSWLLSILCENMVLLRLVFLYSLENIYKELAVDIEGFSHPGHGDLTGWAKQGDPMPFFSQLLSGCIWFCCIRASIARVTQPL